MESLNSLERLLFAQAVWEYGSGAWITIAELLSRHPLIVSRKLCFTAQSCETIYHELMEEAGLDGSGLESKVKARPHYQLAKKYYDARLVELRHSIMADEAQFKDLAQEIVEIRSGRWDKKIGVDVTGPEKEPTLEDISVFNEKIQTETIDEPTEQSPEEPFEAPAEFPPAEIQPVAPSDHISLEPPTQTPHVAPSETVDSSALDGAASQEESTPTEDRPSSPMDLATPPKTPELTTQDLEVEQEVSEDLETMEVDDSVNAAPPVEVPDDVGSQVEGTDPREEDASEEGSTEHVEETDPATVIPEVTIQEITDHEDGDHVETPEPNEDEISHSTERGTAEPPESPEPLDEEPVEVVSQQDQVQDRASVEETSDREPELQLEDSQTKEAPPESPENTSPAQEMKHEEKATTTVDEEAVMEDDIEAAPSPPLEDEQKPETNQRITRSSGQVLSPGLITRSIRSRKENPLAESEEPSTPQIEDEVTFPEETEHSAFPSESVTPAADMNDVEDALREPRKRKASQLEDEVADSPNPERDRKRPRADSEQVDEEETGSTITAGRRRSRLISGDPGAQKKFQTVIYMLHSRISQHRNGNIFHHPIKDTDAPDYHEIVLRAIDLKTIKARIREGHITNTLEFQRDIYLMFSNAMMYNRPSSEIYRMAEEMMQESEEYIDAHRQTEGFAARGH